MDTTSAILAAGGLVGSKELIVKVLGPTADYLGSGLKNWTEKSHANVGRIFTAAARRLGGKIDEPGSVPPRLLKEILSAGPFCEDPLMAEYFGGVLASSRSGVSRDDRGAQFASMVSRLSTYQVRAHFVFYSFFKKLFDGSPVHHVNSESARRDCQIVIPLSAFSAAMEILPPEDAAAILEHSVIGLVGEDLLSTNYEWGPPEEISLRRLKGHTDSCLVIQPSVLGIQLFLWAHGHGNVRAATFLNNAVSLSSDIPITILPGIRSIVTVDTVRELRPEDLG